MTRILGPLLIVTGIGHAMLGLVLFCEPLTEMVAEGVLDAIRNGQFDRQVAFWFMLLGPACALLGRLVMHARECGDGFGHPYFNAPQAIRSPALPAGSVV